MYWLAQGQTNLAVCALIAFHCLLRPGEMGGLEKKDVVLGKHNGVVFLRKTKGGLRRGAAESVTLDDAQLLALLKRHCASLTPEQTLLGMTTGKFREHLQCACEALDLGRHLFRPYSLRRGGATHYFRCGRSMESIIVRGRWQGAKSARIYIVEGLGQAADIVLSEAQSQTFAFCARSLVEYCQAC